MYYPGEVCEKFGGGLSPLLGDVLDASSFDGLFA